MINFMTQKDVREQYPNQFVKFDIAESRVVGDKEYVDDIAVFKAIPDRKEAMKEFVPYKEASLFIALITKK